jgi:ParB-like chromosome segregation protein Spo0J
MGSNSPLGKGLEFDQRPIDELVPYARNARTHSDEQVAEIAASMREFGWTNPVLVDGESGIIAGHGRVLAARKLGYTDVPCIKLDHLSETQKRAYIIADNKLAEKAGWDRETLGLELEELHGDGFDLALTGFSGEELMGLGIGDVDFGAGDESDQGKLDETEPEIITCPSCGERFTRDGTSWS